MSTAPRIYSLFSEWHREDLCQAAFSQCSVQLECRIVRDRALALLRDPSRAFLRSMLRWTCLEKLANVLCLMHTTLIA
jgi:hypothetical protein